MTTIPPPHDDTYWVEEGTFLAGPTPMRSLSGDPNEMIHTLVTAGIHNFIDLTHIDEFNGTSYLQFLQRHPEHDSLRFFNFPIDDFGTPTEQLMRKILSTINQILKDGGRLYLHCYGGIGRTGTVVGCYLVEQGMSGNQALTKIMAIREGLGTIQISSPETSEQINFVLNWQNHWLSER